MNQKTARKLRRIAKNSLFDMRDTEIRRTIKFSDMARWSKKTAMNIVKSRFNCLNARDKRLFLSDPPRLF